MRNIYHHGTTGFPFVINDLGEREYLVISPTGRKCTSEGPVAWVKTLCMVYGYKIDYNKELIR